MKKTIFILLIIFSSGFISAQQPPTTPPVSFKPVEDSEKNADIFLEMGMDYYKTGQLEVAKMYLIYAIDMYGRLSLQAKRAVAEEWMKKTEIAMADREMETAKTQIEQHSYIRVLTSLSTAKEIYEKYDEAEKLKEVDELIKKNGELSKKGSEARDALNLGQKAYDLKKYDIAQENLKKARAIYEELEWEEGVEECDKLLLKIEEQNKPKDTGIKPALFVLSLLLAWLLSGKAL